jgi:uncharacterized protein YjbI with pentapeptide repeats
MSGWFINDVNLSGSKIQNANLSGVAISDCRLAGATIDGVLVEELFKAYHQINSGNV